MTKGATQTFTGGSGADTFEFLTPSDTRAYTGVITDFEAGVDTLIIDGTTLSGLTGGSSLDGFEFTDDDSGNLVIGFTSDGGTAGHTVTLLGTTEADLFL